MVKFSGLLPSRKPLCTAKTKVGYRGEPELGHAHQNPSKFCSSERPGGGGASWQLGSRTLERSPVSSLPGTRLLSLQFDAPPRPNLDSPQHLSLPLLERPSGK